MVKFDQTKKDILRLLVESLKLIGLVAMISVYIHYRQYALITKDEVVGFWLKAQPHPFRRYVMSIICNQCGKEADKHTDGICNECWEWAFEYVESLEKEMTETI